MNLNHGSELINIMTNKSIIDTNVVIEKRENGSFTEWVIAGTDIQHREDGPAAVCKMEDGSIHEEWRRFGRLFRLDGPAQTTRGGKFYYVNNKLHREDGPAIESDDGVNRYYIAGLLMADKKSFDEKLIEWKALGRIKFDSFLSPSGIRTDVWRDIYGTSFRRRDNGNLHREDGPALHSTIMANGQTAIWYINGLRHRDDGQPAFVSPIGWQ